MKHKNFLAMLAFLAVFVATPVVMAEGDEAAAVEAPRKKSVRPGGKAKKAVDAGGKAIIQEFHKAAADSLDVYAQKLVDGGFATDIDIAKAKLRKTAVVAVKRDIKKDRAAASKRRAADSAPAAE